MAGIKGDVSIRKYHAGHTGNTRNILLELLCSENPAVSACTQIGTFPDKTLFA